MANLFVLALQADMTQVATLVIATERNRRSYPELDFTEEHHGVSHHKSDPALVERRLLLTRLNGFCGRIEACCAVPNISLKGFYGG
jgi:hypothetical protein